MKFKQAVDLMKTGGVIAYPTEAVYGLGCDPLNYQAVAKILDLKSRSVAQGLILIADNFDLLKPYVNLEILSVKQIKAALDTWPGPYTWVFPVSPLVPDWIRGDFPTVAVRVTAHPVAAQLSREFGGPIVSTSANISGKAPAKSPEEVLAQFPKGIDAIVPGALGAERAPSEIRDVQTGVVLREKA